MCPVAFPLTQLGGFLNLLISFPDDSTEFSISCIGDRLAKLSTAIQFCTMQAPHDLNK